MKYLLKLLFVAACSMYTSAIVNTNCHGMEIPKYTHKTIGEYQYTYFHDMDFGHKIVFHSYYSHDALDVLLNTKSDTKIITDILFSKVTKGFEKVCDYAKKIASASVVVGALAKVQPLVAGCLVAKGIYDEIEEVRGGQLSSLAQIAKQQGLGIFHTSAYDLEFHNREMWNMAQLIPEEDVKYYAETKNAPPIVPNFCTYEWLLEHHGLKYHCDGPHSPIKTKNIFYPF